MENLVHESDDRLELYALGRLPAADIETVEDHLLVCVSCRDRLEEEARSAVALRDALREDSAGAREPAHKREKGFFAWFAQPRFALAGGFAALLVAAGVYWTSAGRVAPVASLQLTAMRGDMQTVVRAKEVDLTLTDAPAGSGTLQVELVDGSGAKVWGSPETAHGTMVEAKIDRQLPTGDYFVRLYNAGGNLLHEYGFHVE